MDRIIEQCAGMDVHRDTVTACVRFPATAGERVQQIRTFKTTTAELLALAVVTLAVALVRGFPF